MQSLIRVEKESPGVDMYEIGKIYNRQKDIHALYKGQERGGIATPSAAPYVFLFTGDTGEAHGYKDGWNEEGIFLYTGEGQIGDMEFVRGNRAIRDHAENGKDLLLFEKIRKGFYRFIGPFSCTSWEYRQAPDTNGNLRQAIVFCLLPLEDAEKNELVQENDEEEISDLAKLKELALAAAKVPQSQASKESKRNYYKRSKAVKDYVLARASGVCELCNGLAPFKRKSGKPYLEPHHTRRVSDGGPDHPRWVGGICPNCHREIHYGVNGKEKNRRLEEILGELEEDK